MSKFLVVRFPQEQAYALRAFLDVLSTHSEIPVDVQPACKTLSEAKEEEEIIDWLSFDFTKFIRQMLHLQRRLKFIAIGHLVNNVLREGNCGVDFIDNKRALVEYSIDNNMCFTERVAGEKTTNKITSIQLNMSHPKVKSILDKLPDIR